MRSLSEIQHQLVNLTNSFTAGDRVIRMNLEEFIDSDLDPDSDHYETTNHYVSYCPYCFEHYGYEKKKLYIEKDTLSRGFCHRCHSTYFNYTSDLSFDVISSRQKLKQFTLVKLNKVNLSVSGHDNSLAAYNNCVNDRDGILDLLKLRNLESFPIEQEDTLKKRNYDRYSKIVDELGLKGTKIDDEHGIIMIPFYLNDELIYWQSKNVGYSPKYYMPPISHKPFYIPKYRGNKIVIVEGIFDAIACLTLYPDRTPIALLGSYATEYHIWLLRNYIQPTDCLISMDNINLSVGILFQLRRAIPTITSFNLYCGKYNQDPDELLLSLDDNQLEEFINTHKYANSFEWE